MQAIMELLFDIFYLSTVITIGVIMVKKSDVKFYQAFGIMALILGIGDSFHLVPRVYALLTNGLDANAYSLGLGKIITSVTMTIFYLILYELWRKKFNITSGKFLRVIIYLLAIARIALCLFPQNLWTSVDPSYLWGIYRNIPFLIMGIIICVLFYKEALNDKYFKYAWLAIALSFLFYVPVVLWASTYSIIGVLMIPKTLAYVWLMSMGYKELKDQ